MMMMHSNNNRLKRADSNGNSRRCSVVFNITIPSDDRHPSNVDDQTKFLDWSEPIDGEATSTGTDIDDAADRTGCCKCSKCCSPCLAATFCFPCNRIQRLACCQRCRRKKDGGHIQSSSSGHDAKESAWKRMVCSKCCRKSPKDVETMETAQKATTSTAAAAATAMDEPTTPGKCSACLNKFLCCKRTNKIKQSDTMAVDASSATSERRKCCFCIPCCGKTKKTTAAQQAAAWSERRESILSEQPKQGCCSRFLCCCRKKETIESRRTSMNSKKQSIAPTIPIEDTRPKLDMSLVEHTSMMKAAIPILPICLAWFCLLCNCFIPGLGTIFSGLFCLCLGVPRFSQHDGARARIGSFVINCIVGVAQAFTLLFCLVGWGWAIWWGTIMLRVAKKRRKIEQAERDAEMQQEEQTTSSNRTAMPPIQMSQNQRDVEAGHGSGSSATSGGPAA